jgi:predicted secreted protein
MQIELACALAALALFALSCKAWSSDAAGRAAMVELENQSSATLKVGERASFAAPVHGSVGIAAECVTSDAAVLRLVSADTTYLHPENMRPGMTGGDAARRVYIFEAAAPGQATVTYRKVFRGTLEQTKEIKVTVN